MNEWKNLNELTTFRTMSGENDRVDLTAVMAGEAAPEELPTVEMNLNRPFIYLITADDGSALFIGVVRDPSA